MSKSKKNATAGTAVPTINTTGSKADAIRDYAKGNPGVGPSDIAKALVAAGVDVTPARVSGVLRNGTASGRVDVATIKMAGTFVKAHGGKVADAVEAIDSVGAFIDECGSSAKAKAALEAYEALRASM